MFSSPKPSTFQWLLHAFEQFDIDANVRTIVSRRNGASLTGLLHASTPLRLRQTDAWPIAPDEGYPTLKRPVPEKRWHFTAESERTDRIRIASIFSATGPGESALGLHVSVAGDRVAFDYQGATGYIDLSPDSSEVLRANCGAEQVAIDA